MIREWQQRLQQTHGTRFELLRHFLPRFLDSDLLSAPGAGARVAGGIGAVLISSWMLLAYLLLFKYKTLGDMNLQHRIASEVQLDLAALAGMAVCAAMVLAATLWQALYPSLRDYLSMAGFPVSSADIFLAKFTSVVIAFTAFLAAFLFPSSLVFSLVTGANLFLSFGTLTAASSITFFGAIAIQGLLLNTLPARWFERVMITIQALLATAGLGGFSIAAWKGQELLSVLARVSLWQVALLPPAIAAAVYLISFRRYRRLLLEAPRLTPPHRSDLLSRLLHLWIRDPRELAAFTFLYKTMARSRTHRLAALVYIGLAVAWMAKSAVEAVVQTSGHPEWNRVLLTSGPLALTVFTLIGLRHLFSLPTELRANWLFQITEREGRASWMRAVERFVLACGVAPSVLTGSVFVWRSDGPIVGIAWTAIAFFLAAIGFERLFRDWRKLPFTCSYIPGKRPPLLNLTLFTVTMLTMMPVAWIIYKCSTNPASFLILLTLEIGIWIWARQARLRTWGIAPLRYEDQIEADVDTYGFSGEGTTLAQEQFQREWTDYLRGADTDPILRPLEEGETRSSRLMEWLRAIPQDLRFALRLLLNKPGFAASIIVTLGLGLGLNAAFFTIFNAFLLRPLAVRDPASLISFEFETKYRTDAHLSWQEFQLLASGLRELPDIAACSMEGTGLDGHAAKVALVSKNFFNVLGAGAALGRPIQPEDNEPVVVLSHRAWQTRFASDPQIIGRQVQVNGHPFEVIGVAAPEFIGVNVGTVAIAPKSMARYGIATADFWVPIDVWMRTPGMMQYPVYGVLARLPSGMSESQARQMAGSLAAQLTRTKPDYDRIRWTNVESLDIPVTWTALQFSLPLLFAFVLTMLIPCANAANMMLARAMSRQRELGTRLSIGASRGRIIRQLLAESFVLALLASAVGIAVSRLALQAFSQSLYATAPPTLLFRLRIPDFVVDSTVYLYMLLVAMLTTALFALAPAAHATRVAISFALRGELGILRPSRVRDALVVVQVSACVMLLATAGVLLRGSGRSLQLDRGYESRGLFAIANQSPEDAAELMSLLDRESWVDSRGALAGLPAAMSSELMANAARPGWHNTYYMGGSSEFFRLLKILLL
ncbi:MAG: ABC transporter permease, partial [Bryobacteraceae bacterium]